MLETSVLPAEVIITRETISQEDPKTNFEPIPERGRKLKRPKKDKSKKMPPLPEFVLDGWKSSFQGQEYNGLKDRHLIGHFYNKRLRKLLKHNNLISKNGHVVEGKTCLTDHEIVRLNRQDEDLTYKYSRNGTVLLGLKLPKIHPFPQLEHNRLSKTRSTSVTQPNSQIYESSNITPTGIQDVSTTTNLQEASSRDNSLSLINTPLTNPRSTSVKDKREVSFDRSPSYKKSSLPKRSIQTTNILKELEPMSKEDLKAAFNKYKTRLNQTVIVDESPELNQPTPGASMTLKEGIYNSAPMEKSEGKVDRSQSSEKKVKLVESPKQEKVATRRSGSISPNVGRRNNKQSGSNQESMRSKLQGSKTLEPISHPANVKLLNRQVIEQKNKQKEQEKEGQENKKSVWIQPKSIFQMQIEQANLKNARKDITQSVLRQSSSTKLQEGNSSPTKSIDSPQKDVKESVEIQRKSREPSRSPRKDLSQSRVQKSPSTKIQGGNSSPTKSIDSPQKDIKESVEILRKSREPSRSPRKDLSQSRVQQSTTSKSRDEKSPGRKNTNSPRKEVLHQSLQDKKIFRENRKTEGDEAVRTSKDDLKKLPRKMTGPTREPQPTAKNSKETTAVGRGRAQTLSPNQKNGGVPKGPEGLAKLQQTGKKIQMMRVLNQSFDAKKKESQRESLNKTVAEGSSRNQEEKPVIEELNNAVLGFSVFLGKPFDIILKQKIHDKMQAQKQLNKPPSPKTVTQPTKVNENSAKK